MAKQQKSSSTATADSHAKIATETAISLCSTLAIYSQTNIDRHPGGATTHK
ncbi:MAG: hypothetical protein IKL54_03570 [Bacteroidaceae bacterium]|nr:hypothetical protein [Bacteroidaceae bacterium]